MDYEIDIEYGNIPLTVRYEIDEYDLEPYSWGQSRGKLTDIIVFEVLVKDVNIIDLLSKEQIETIEEIVREEL